MFGLSTDYAVFLLSRIKEAHDHGASTSDSVALGMQRTGRIITAAALLFAVAIGAFATSQIGLIKELGVGTALAVLIDATIIRALLVPSLMALLGKWNWWAPAAAAPLPRAVRLQRGRPGSGPGVGAPVPLTLSRRLMHRSPGEGGVQLSPGRAGERLSRPRSRARATASARVATPSLR